MLHVIFESVTWFTKESRGLRKRHVICRLESREYGVERLEGCGGSPLSLRLAGHHRLAPQLRREPLGGGVEERPVVGPPLEGVRVVDAVGGGETVTGLVVGDGEAPSRPHVHQPVLGRPRPHLTQQPTVAGGDLDW